MEEWDEEGEEAGNVQSAAQSEAEERGKELHIAMAYIHERTAKTWRAFIESGIMWKKIMQEKLYKSDLIKTFDMFIEKETPYKRRSIYNIMDLASWYEGFLDKEEQAEPWKLIKVLPLISTVQDAEDWFYRACTLNRESYDNEIKEAKGKPPTDTCDHENIEIIHLRQCTGCKKYLGRVVEPKEEVLDRETDRMGESGD